MADSKFDLDPEALAWARGKVENYIKKMRRFEEQASHATDREGSRRERQWLLFGNMLESEFIGGRGCVIAAFDERLPKILPALSTPAAGGENR